MQIAQLYNFPHGILHHGLRHVVPAGDSTIAAIHQNPLYLAANGLFIVEDVPLKLVNGTALCPDWQVQCLNKPDDTLH